MVKKDHIFDFQVMRKDQIILSDGVQQCRDEASIQFYVGNHPFIVTPHHAFQNNDNVYLGEKECILI